MVNCYHSELDIETGVGRSNNMSHIFFQKVTQFVLYHPIFSETKIDAVISQLSVYPLCENEKTYMP